MTPAEKWVSDLVSLVCTLQRMAQQNEDAILACQAEMKADPRLAPVCNRHIADHRRQAEELRAKAEWHLNHAQEELRYIDARQKGEAA